MKTFATILAAMIIATMMSCSKQQEEGPMEKAGKQVDETIEKAGTYTSNKMKEMGQVIKHTGDDLKERAEK